MIFIGVFRFFRLILLVCVGRLVINNKKVIVSVVFCFSIDIGFSLDNFFMVLFFIDYFLS